MEREAYKVTIHSGEQTIEPIFAISQMMKSGTINESAGYAIMQLDDRGYNIHLVGPTYWDYETTFAHLSKRVLEFLYPRPEFRASTKITAIVPIFITTPTGEIRLKEEAVTELARAT